MSQLPNLPSRNKSAMPKSILRPTTNSMTKDKNSRNQLPGLMRKASSRSQSSDNEGNGTGKNKTLISKPSFSLERKRSNISSKNSLEVSKKSVRLQPIGNSNDSLKDPISIKITDLGEKENQKNQDLDTKLTLWNEIIEQRKKLFQKMVQDINAGHDPNEDDEDYKEKQRKLARQNKNKRNAKKATQGYLLETRIDIEMQGQMDQNSSDKIDRFKTPDEYLENQVSDIFQGSCKKAEVINFRNLEIYMQEFEKSFSKPKNVDIGAVDLKKYKK